MSEPPPPSSLPHETPPPPRDTSPPRDTPFQIWSHTQRGVLIAFILILSSTLLLFLAHDRMYVSNPPPSRGERYDDLASRIDPNTATWQELAVLPAIGEKRAKDIIAYREASVARQSNSLAFARPQDLMEVKGIGPAMIETLRPHLTFPPTTSTTTTTTTTTASPADSENPRTPAP